MKNSNCLVMVVLGLGLTGFNATPWAAEADQRDENIVAMYTFDGRAPVGKALKRPYDTRAPFNGEAYVPNSNRGECGPILENPGPDEHPNYYRSYFNHAADKTTEGRQVLELRQHHIYRLDTYRTKPEQGTLPSEGSFTWELVARVEQFDGTNHLGMLIDASRGAGRIVNYPGEKNNKAIVTRLWLAPVKDKKEAFMLCFTVPLNDENRGETVTTELNKGQWYHLAAVYDDATHEAKLYVDGALKAMKPVTACGNRTTGFGLAGAFSPDVFRIDHPLRLQIAMFDAIVMTRDARNPETFVLLHD